MKGDEMKMEWRRRRRRAALDNNKNHPPTEHATDQSRSLCPYSCVSPESSLIKPVRHLSCFFHGRAFPGLVFI